MSSLWKRESWRKKTLIALQSQKVRLEFWKSLESDMQGFSPCQQDSVIDLGAQKAVTGVDNPFCKANSFVFGRDVQRKAHWSKTG